MCRVLCDHRVAVAVGVVDIKLAVVAEVRVKGQTQKALFTSGDNQRRDVQKRLGDQVAVADDADTPYLFEHEQAVASVSRVSHEQRGLEPLGYGLERDVQGGEVQ